MFFVLIVLSRGLPVSSVPLSYKGTVGFDWRQMIKKENVCDHLILRQS
jgi:hypothetical protein